MKITPYPLCWPHGWPETPVQERRWSITGGRVNSNWNKTLKRLTAEIEKLGGSGLVISTNMPLRKSDGMPYGNTGLLEEPGAAIYFNRDKRQYVFAQDAYELVADNLRSLAIALEGLRQMERHGGDKIMERAFQGFEALPAPSVRQWCQVLEISENSTLGEAEASYRRLAKRFHPDTPGGSQVAMRNLNNAILEARVRLG